jgi:CelD/BcsL family acetyltransferase involved in cellulose biosynthesis
MCTVPLTTTDTTLFVFEIHTNGELVGLGPEWQELFQRIGCDNVFLTFEWLSQWWFHLGRKDNLNVIVVRDRDHRLIAVAPLYVSCHASPLRVRRLAFLGDGFVGSDHLDFLVDPDYLPGAVDCICEFLINHREDWDYIRLSDANANSVVIGWFRRRMIESGMKWRNDCSSVCPYLTLPKLAEDFRSGLSPKLRKNLKYYARSLEREGRIESVTVERGCEVEHAFNDLLRLHEARFSRRRRRSTFLDSRVRQFHRGVLHALSESGRARIHFLQLNGTRIAALYGFSVGRRFFYYQSGADSDYSRFSVGTLLIHSVIENLIRDGYAELDFLRGNESYKQLWSRDIRRLYTETFYGSSVKSWIVQKWDFSWLLYRTCKSELRKAAQGLLSLWHKTIHACKAGTSGRA